MFIELWQGLRDLYHDNDNESARNNAKRFINWTLRDLANEYDWGCLKGTLSMTATAANMLYDLTQIAQITATAETLYVYSNSTADAGIIVYGYGKRINTDTTLDITADSWTLIATATATGGISFSHIDSFRKATTTGSVYIVSSTGGVVATMAASDTYMANDINKINAVSNVGDDNPVDFIDYATQRKGSPNLSSQSQYSGYDNWHNGAIQLLNSAANSIYVVSFQRIPRYLVKNNDRTEFNYSLYPGIIDAAYIGWGLRFQDEADGTQGKAAYKNKLQEVVSSYFTGKDKKIVRVMPLGRRRSL